MQSTKQQQHPENHSAFEKAVESVTETVTNLVHNLVGPFVEDDANNEDYPTMYSSSSAKKQPSSMQMRQPQNIRKSTTNANVPSHTFKETIMEKGSHALEATREYAEEAREMATNMIHKAKEAITREHKLTELTREQEEAFAAAEEQQPHQQWVVDERSLFDNPISRHNFNRKISPQLGSVSKRDHDEAQFKLEQVRAYFDAKLTPEYRTSSSHHHEQQQLLRDDTIRGWIAHGQSLPLNGQTGADAYQQTNTFNEMTPFKNEAVAY